jgi:hypothetical protein
MADTVIALVPAESALILALELAWRSLDAKQRAYGEVLIWLLVELRETPHVCDAIFVASRFVHTHEVP